MLSSLAYITGAVRLASSLKLSVLYGDKGSECFVQRLVKKETVACRHAHSQVTYRLFYKSVLLFVLGLAFRRLINDADNLKTKS